MRYFSYFPAIKYNLGGPGTNSVTIRNIFFRFKILEALRNNTVINYDYYVQEGETPETIANKYYKDPEKHWLVMMANDIVDPQFDWCLSYTNFQNYIISKYGSIAQAQLQPHHYQITINRTDSASGITTTTTNIIDQSTYNQNTEVDVSKHLGIDFKLGFTDLGQQFVMSNSPLIPDQVINLVDGTSVTIKTVVTATNCYDYEYGLNESRRQIQLISADYLDQIQNEFLNLAAKG